jgi:hypothetical protein
VRDDLFLRRHFFAEVGDIVFRGGEATRRTLQDTRFSLPSINVTSMLS